MSENFKLKATFTAEDEASPIIRSLLRQVRRLEKANFGISIDKLKTGLLGASVAAAKIADAQKAQANALRSTITLEGHRQRAETTAGANLRNRLSFEARMQRQRQGEERRDARTAATVLRVETANKMRAARQDISAKVRADALAFRSLRQKLQFGARMERQRASEAREIERQDRLRESAHRREVGRIDRENRARRRAFMTIGRTSTGALRDASQGIGTAAMLTGGAAAAGGYAITRSETEADASEINARIYGGLNATQARDTRRWARMTGVDVGMREAVLLDQYVSVLKLGLADSDAKLVAVLNQKLAEGFQIAPEEVAVVTGKQIAAQISNGERFDFKKVYGTANAIQHIAAETATDPRELLQFGFRSIGGAKALGMDPRYAMAFGAAGIQQGIQPFAMAETLDFIGSRIPQLAEFEKQNGIEGQRTRKLLRSLGYGSVTGMNRAKAKDPNRFVYDLHERFAKIKNPERRNEALTAFYGADRFSEGAAISNSMPAFKRAMDLAEASKRIDAIESMWSLHIQKLGFIGRQMDSAFGGLLGSLGELVGPGLKDIGTRLTGWISGNTRTIQIAFYAGLQGLSSGLLGRYGTFNELIAGMFGKVGSNPAAIYEFVKGVGDGLRDVWSALVWIGDAAKSFMQAVGANSAQEMGRLAAQTLGLGMAAKVASPWVSIAKDAAIAIGAGIFSIVKVAGLLGGGAAVAGAGAALGAAAIPVAITATAITLGVAIMNWESLREIWTGIFGRPGWTKRREENDARRARGDNPDPVDSFLNRWFGRAFGQRSDAVTGGSGQGSVRGYAARDRLTGSDLAPAAMPMGGASGGKAMLDAIARAEGTAGRGDYNASLGYGRFLPGGREQDLTSKSLAEIYQLGLHMRRQPGNPNSSALGRYQIVGSTMKDAASALGMDWNTTKFDAATQDAMASWIAKKQGFGAWEGFKRNPAELSVARAAVAGAPTIDTAGLASSFPGQGAAVDAMRPMLGHTEGGAGRGTINRFMRQHGNQIDAARTAWCAGFVNSALASAGIKGSGSLAASSFLAWGNKVDPSAVAKGDVLVEHRGRRPGERGSHVGMATGNTRQGKSGLELEMISGNSGRDGAVATTWESARSLAVRRAAGQVPNAASIAAAQRPAPSDLTSRVPLPAARPGGPGGSGMGGGGVSIGGITVNGTNRDPREIAQEVGREFQRMAVWTTGDLAFDA